MSACPFRPGQRVQVVAEIADPNPLEIGLQGTVAHVWNEGTDLEQVAVDWDSPRSLMLVPGDYPCVVVVGPRVAIVASSELGDDWTASAHVARVLGHTHSAVTADIYKHEEDGK